MRIKKMYQGGLPENKILNIQSESSTDTYSCDYINNLGVGGGDSLDELPIDSIIEYEGTEVPDGWELVEETNIGKSLISISGGGEKTYTIGAWVWTPFEFDTIIRNLGDGFEYDTETYEIKALKDMTVKIDAQISYFGTATGEMNVRILKNNDITNGNIAYANEYTGHTDKSGTLNIVSAITDVVVNDVIQIQFSGVAGTYKINQRDFLTHMTVEEISNPVISINGVESIETKEKNYIQCGFTENFWVPDTNYKLLTFDDVKIGGEVFSYDSETNEVVINESYNINNVKLHFHTMLTTGGELATEAIEVLVYKNDDIAAIINDGLDTKSSRSATSLDYIVDCAPGDRFRVEARSYSNIYLMLATYGRTAFTIEEVVDNTVVSEGNTGEIYSEEETIIGTWIDGKPIYRKVIKAHTETLPREINVGVTNVDDLITGKFQLQQSASKDSGWRTLPWVYNGNLQSEYGNATWVGGWYFNGTVGTVYTQVGSDISSIQKYIIILEYTKTTD